tara:strand:+ start:23 stop:541 length:519 start_codon:yes stop_codon:yes gene_type:complete
MKKYFYIKEGVRSGPFDLEDLKSEEVKRETLVWFQGIKDWKKASEIKELDELFIHVPPPLPTEHTKKFRISIQLMALILIFSAVIAWIEIGSIVVSGPIVALLSLLSFYFSKGESKNIRAVSLLPLLLCVLCFLMIAIGDLNKREALMPIGTVVSIGTILFIILSIGKIKQL